MPSVKPIPDGYHSVTPYLVIRDAARALDFYKQAFGAAEVMRLADPTGKVGHAEIRIGDSVIMMADEFPDRGVRGVESYGGSPISIMLYVADVDAVFARAIAAGAKVKEPIDNKFYGDRSGTLVDPFGHTWTIATHIEDVAPEEITKRIAGMANHA